MPITQGGQVYPFSSIPGVSVSQAIAGVADYSTQDNSVPSPDGSNSAPPAMSPIWYFFLIIAVLIAVKWLIEHEKSGVQPAVMGISVYNWLAVTLMAILGIAGIKVIVNKYNIPGLQTLINAV